MKIQIGSIQYIYFYWFLRNDAPIEIDLLIFFIWFWLKPLPILYKNIQ